jgi:uncharacterized membrane protein YkoI
MRNPKLARQSAALVLAAATAAMACVHAFADDKRRGHDEAYEASQSGKILPLASILDRLRPKIGTDIVEVEFENSDGRQVYEIRYVDGAGRRHEIQVDPRDGAILAGEAD